MSNRLMKLKNEYNNEVTPLVSLTQDYRKHTKENYSIYPYEWFSEIVLVDFEGHKLPIIKKYDEMLRNYYGDYMQLPPEEKRIGHNIEAYWRE